METRQIKPKDRIHFPNLEALRFITALLIIVIHTEDIKYRHGGETVSWIARLEPWGNIDVSLFFVLSGFLITFILLKEKQDTGAISLKDFYTRRILKIWPLYYFIMIVAFFILPYFGHAFYGDYTRGLNNHFWKSLFSYVLFLPPLLFSGSGFPESIGPTWTVRIEEAFYIFWPLVVRRSNRFLRTCYIIIISVIAVRLAVVLLTYIYRDNYYYYIRLNLISTTLFDYRFSSMALGGIAAYLYVNDYQRILQFLYRKNIQWLVYGITLVLLLTRVEIPLISQEFYSALFAYLILNLAANPQSVIKLRYKWMAYLGSLSYGLYLYHPIMRILSIEAIKYLYNRNIEGWQMQVLYFSMTMVSTILITMLSYKLLEKPFLNLKKRFSFIYS